MRKANKQEMELRAGFDAALLAQGHICAVVTIRVTEEQKKSSKTTAKAVELIFKDFEEINIEPPHMVSKLLITLEEGMQKELINKQSSGVGACAR